jgi:aspartyl-tRNA(Asn)/glutamyl-tRNA(Gln) amidotransferase subunit B
MPEIVSVALKVGLEVHVELATRTKMFSRAPNVAHPDHDGAAPNTLLDPVVLGLPGALPVMNRAAVEMSMMVGMALGCTIAPQSRWDRKSYFYPDMPKNYQISQYQLPLCFDGAVDLPEIAEDGTLVDAVPPVRIGIIRAHLEEDAGKLLHEATGGGRLDWTIIDLNRAGTPLLEIVTQPDFTAADQVVRFAQMLRNVCRFLGVTEGIMQKGHMRFEPNINTVLTLADGHVVRTPIVEIKNLNSFKAVRAAIEFELLEQPRRWREDALEMGPGTKTTRGWEEVPGTDLGGRTFLQRSKEDAHDYRYFPDPDLPVVVVDEAWRAAVRARVPELPLARARRYARDYALSVKEAAALVEERAVCELFERAVETTAARGVLPERAGRLCANLVLQSGAKRANERSTEAGRPVLVHELGIDAGQIGVIAALRDAGKIGANAADELFGLLCEPVSVGTDPETLAQSRGMLLVRDEGAIEAWIAQAIAENAKPAEDVRAGKMQAIGRLVGAVMKLSGGTADAADVRARLLKKLGQG